MVKVSLEMKKRDVVWVSLVVVLLGVGVVFAYGDFSTGDATVLGHSSDEVNVDIGGAVKSLQAAIDAGDFGVGGVGVFKYDSSRSVIDSAIISAVDDVTLSDLEVGDLVRAELSCSARAWQGKVTVWVELASGAADVLVEPSQIRWISGSASYYGSGGGISVGLYEVTSAGDLTFSMKGAISNPASSKWYNCQLLAYTVGSGGGSSGSGGGSGGSDVVWEGGSVQGSPSGWNCVDVPVKENCGGLGCNIIIQGVFWDGNVWPYTGYLYYDDVADQAVLNDGLGSGGRYEFDLSDGTYNIGWEHGSFLLLRDCDLSGTTGCVDSYDDMHLCAYASDRFIQKVALVKI
ncbi:MAG: hypothetical protein QF704_14190 [Anaerolineales bacterium]|nr:hypothetical protein [Anaerolineales bacterium]